LFFKIRTTFTVSLGLFQQLSYYVCHYQKKTAVIIVIDLAICEFERKRIRTCFRFCKYATRVVSFQNVSCDKAKNHPESTKHLS